MVQRTRCPSAADCLPRPVLRGTARNDALQAGLRRLGIEPRLSCRDDVLMAGGAALRLSLDELAGSPELAAHVLARLRRMLVQRIPVTVTLCNLGTGGRGFAALECLCRRLSEVLAAPCIDRRRLGIAVYARDLQLPAFQLVSRVLLGGGSRYLYLDQAQLPRDGDDAPDAGNAAVWSGLYLLRHRRNRVLPVYGGGSRTRCPLLGDEATGALLPHRSTLVPPDTAWLPLDVPLARFADARGVLREDALCRALRRGLVLGDRLFDQLSWPDHTQHNDAYLNRRIAVTLDGIGELTARRGEDPGSLECLRGWDRLLARVHESLWDQSRELARQRGLLPALAVRNPAARCADRGQRRDWQRRWHAALETDAVRHRNLLVLSPYGLLPRNGAAHPAYTDLLPLLAHADVLSFGDAPSFARWSIHEFKHFHRRACAIMARRNAAAFVAAGT